MDITDDAVVECTTPPSEPQITINGGEVSPPLVVPGVKPIRPSCSKRVAKEDRSLRKKDDKSLEQVKKVLSSTVSTDEKLALMCQKYSEVCEENRKLQLTVKQHERKLGQVQREKEQLQADHSKVVLTRSRLESLCRELQRQNKAVKDESLTRIREEEEKRKELSARFNVTLNEITTLMQQNTDKNAKLRDENKDVTDKFKSLCEQYELREQQVDKLIKQNQLEIKLSETKLAKVKMELMEEKEGLLKELQNYHIRCQDMEATETALRGQITLYSDKYEEFQTALGRSNEVFSDFKTEMEKMAKKIGRLEKETLSWKSRWENSHRALLEMAEDKQLRDQELALATRQLKQLQRLCRTLQDERTRLQTALKERGGDIEKSSDIPLTNGEDSQEPIVTEPLINGALEIISTNEQASDSIQTVKSSNSKTEINGGGVETLIMKSLGNGSIMEDSSSSTDSSKPEDVNNLVSCDEHEMPLVPGAEAAAKPDQTSEIKNNCSDSQTIEQPKQSHINGEASEIAPEAVATKPVQTKTSPAAHEKQKKPKEGGRKKKK